MIFLGLFMSIAMAKTNCDRTAFNVRAIYDFPASGYWMQPMGDRYISYTATGGIGSQIYDLEKKERVLAPQDVDGYPLPEGDLYVHPNPIRFFKLEERLRQGEQGSRSPPVYTDEDHKGYYQSVGETSKTGETRTIRILTAEGFGRIQDYKIEKKRNGDYKFTKKYRQPVEICKNLGRDHLDFEMPILSRKGSMFATKDYNTGTTKVYKIRMPSGSCNEIVDLGFQTDKASFSFDDENIAFNTSATEIRKTAAGREYRVEKKTLNIFSLETKESKTISTPSEDVMYHSYRQDGSLMYTRRTNPNDSQDERGELVMVDPSATTGSRLDTKGATDLGRAWAKDCETTISSDSAAAVGFRMKKTDCAILVAAAPQLSQDAKNFCSLKTGTTDATRPGAR